MSLSAVDSVGPGPVRVQGHVVPAGSQRLGVHQYLGGHLRGPRAGHLLPDALPDHIPHLPQHHRRHLGLLAHHHSTLGHLLHAGANP